MNIDNSGSSRHDYGDGMQATLVVERFISSRNTRESLTSDPRVRVRLIPLVHARVCQRVLDLTLKDTGLGAFVNYLVGGEVSHDPDHNHQIPLDMIQQELLVLCEQLGVDKPEVAVGDDTYLAPRR
jgi:hypothetical protein